MAYFTNFPQVLYGTPEVNSIIKDISLRFSILPIVLANKISWFDVLYKDYETMEDMAQNYYGDPSLYWVIMVMNGIVDPFYDLPLRIDELQDYIKSVHLDPYGAHHYTWGGINVSSDYPNAKMVSNEDYEIALNESKRPLKILDPIYIPTIVGNLKGLL